MQTSTAIVSASGLKGLAGVQQCQACQQLQRRLAMSQLRATECRKSVRRSGQRMIGEQSKVRKHTEGERSFFCRAGSSLIDADVSGADADVSRADPEGSKRAPNHLPGWSDFCDKVSGEWEGYEVTFESANGQSWEDYTTVELPYEVVPEAFREWEIRLFDWQTQCSSLGNKEDGTILFKLARLLPTVGCEADAATVHTVTESVANGTSTSGPIAYLPDGSYSLTWPDAASEGGQRWQVEHGLVDNNGLRVRVTLALERSTMSAKPALTSIKVARERWDSAFEKGESLSSCGGKMRGFADDPRLEQTKLEGEWDSDQHTFTLEGASGGFQVEHASVEVVKKLGKDRVNVLLPAGVWVRVGETEGGDFEVSASWLQAEGHGRSATRVYGEDGKLQRVVLSEDTRR